MTPISAFCCLGFLFVQADPLLKDLPRKDVVHALDSVGFTDQMKEGSITSLSGGERGELSMSCWKCHVAAVSAGGSFCTFTVTALQHRAALHSMRSVTPCGSFK